MGTGPILLPPVVAAAGILQSCVLLLVMILLSTIGAQFVIETLGITNCMKRYGYRSSNITDNTIVTESDTS